MGKMDSTYFVRGPAVLRERLSLEKQRAIRDRGTVSQIENPSLGGFGLQNMDDPLGSGGPGRRMLLVLVLLRSLQLLLFFVIWRKLDGGMFSLLDLKLRSLTSEIKLLHLLKLELLLI